MDHLADLGAIFIAAELFTSGFVLLWFGVGAIVAALLALTVIVGLPLQIVIFFAVSIALTIASRTIFERFFVASSPERELKTGIDSLPGRVGVVVEPSAGESGEGAVKVFGSVWRAFPAEGEDLLRAGEQVRLSAWMESRCLSEEPAADRHGEMLDVSRAGWDHSPGTAPGSAPFQRASAQGPVATPQGGADFNGSRTLFFLAFILFVVLVTAAKSFRVVGQASVMIVERLGNFHKAAAGGLNIILPFVDRPRSIYWSGVRPGISTLDLRSSCWNSRPSQSSLATTSPWESIRCSTTR